MVGYSHWSFFQPFLLSGSGQILSGVCVCMCVCVCVCVCVREQPGGLFFQGKPVPSIYSTSSRRRLGRLLSRGAFPDAEQISESNLFLVVPSTQLFEETLLFSSFLP